MTFVKALFTLLVGSTIQATLADDWVSYGGNHRDHTSLEKGMRLDWGNEEPKRMWTLEVGLGFSSVVEADGIALCQGHESGKNTLFCVDSESGQIKWTHTYPCRKGDKFFLGGTPSTPTISAGFAYVLSHEGDLYAIDSKSGKVVWSKDLVSDLNGIRPEWGYSGCPLLTDGKVIVETGNPSGSLVALNAKTGSLLWRGGGHEAGYSSVKLRSYSKGELLLFNQFGLSIHETISGKEIKSYQHKTRYGVNAALPVEFGNKVLISSGYGKGSALVDLARITPHAVWETDDVSCQIASMVKLNDFAYGINGQAGTRSSQSTLFCLDLQKGQKVWEKKGFGLGSLILVKETLVVLSDIGELFLVRANPKKYEELANFQVLSGKNNWAPPVYSNGKMHCRSSNGEWVCLAMSEI